MHQLADRVLLSRSGVTRLIDRLVPDGSVERDPCLTDARGAEAVLTAGGPGAAADRRAATHLRGIADHFLDAIDPVGSRGRRARRCATSSPAWTPTSPWRIGGPRAHDRAAVRSGRAASPIPTGRRGSIPPASAATALLRHYASRLVGLRAQQHVLPAAHAGQGRRLAGGDAARLPFRGQGPAGRLVPLARSSTRRERAVADGSAPGVRRAARDRPVPRARRRPAR